MFIYKNKLFNLEINPSYFEIIINISYINFFFKLSYTILNDNNLILLYLKNLIFLLLF
jgi:hypothetical protein